MKNIKNALIKTQSNKNFVLNYKEKNKYNNNNNQNINTNKKIKQKKKSSLLSEYFTNYQKSDERYSFTYSKFIKLPIKKKKSNSKNKSKINKTAKNSIKKPKKEIIKNFGNIINNIYNNYMTMTPKSKKNNKFPINTHINKVSNINKSNNNNEKVKQNKTSKDSLSKSCKQISQLSNSKILDKINTKKMICIRNKNIINSPNMSVKLQKNEIIQIEPIDKKIIKNASICRTGKNRPNESEKINQDNIFKVKFEDLNLFFYGICDGHGPYGHLVSNYIKMNLPIILYNNLKTNLNDIKKDNDTISNNYNNYYNIISESIKSSFSQAENQLNNNTDINTNYSGSTCISLLFNNNQIISANVGDSRAIKGQYISQNKKWIYEVLNKEHKPENKEEYLRIIKNKGSVHPFLLENNEYIGPQRVWIQDKNIPGLAMSRAFGDKLFNSVGVISKPDVISFKYKSIDKFVVIASDGLWTYVTSQEAVEIVGKYYEKLDCDKAIEELYSIAKKRWEENDDFIDDIAIIIIFFQ
jgi:serine/threonine protein phosphatase PrpC